MYEGWDMERLSSEAIIEKYVSKQGKLADDEKNVGSCRENN